MLVKKIRIVAECHIIFQFTFFSASRCIPLIGRQRQLSAMTLRSRLFVMNFPILEELLVECWTSTPRAWYQSGKMKILINNNVPSGNRTHNHNVTVTLLWPCATTTFMIYTTFMSLKVRHFLIITLLSKI